MGNLRRVADRIRLHIRVLPFLAVLLFSSIWVLAAFSVEADVDLPSTAAAQDPPMGSNPMQFYDEIMQDDVTIFDEYMGLVNRSSPMYWGAHQYFMNERIFFVQVGGVHNHAYFHTNWDMTPYITNFTNTMWFPERSQLLAFENQTRVGFSNGSRFWIPTPTCPLGNRSMHALEFSPWSRAVYWFCPQDHRLILGEILG